MHGGNDASDSHHGGGTVDIVDPQPQLDLGAMWSPRWLSGAVIHTATSVPTARMSPFGKIGQRAPTAAVGLTTEDPRIAGFRPVLETDLVLQRTRSQVVKADTAPVADIGADMRHRDAVAQYAGSLARGSTNRRSAHKLY